MAKPIPNELLNKREYDYPELIKRYIAKYRDIKGPNAKRNNKDSNAWFMRRVSKDFNLKSETVHRELATFMSRVETDKGIIGRLFLFRYNAKHKETLPVWDEWPLTFFFSAFRGDGVKFGEKGVLYLRGINLHYLPPKYRLRLFMSLVKLKNDSTLRRKTRLRMTWEILKSLDQGPLAEHCVKTYRADHVMSRLAEVHPDTWEIVIGMNVARWHNGGKGVAWKGY
ncbi:hypothetical protein Kuja_0340 [Vibrio phage vB_VchM_Kuja]|uniref:DNA end protector protein n=1 Tax=Vibrio phage vB_VchM_Kuja TaxID=2686437 RepID=A0A6B9J5D8_9CAUD|nr:DNA end protector [Vibrio phage vB_VchM_Kuja]QGZ16025.1 hypothetical protein Kuja_0340 [Vibrio phage vB_VchM_Kuja]